MLIRDQLGRVFIWLWRGLGLIGCATLLLGALSAWAPKRSIALYQWIMARCNWRVSPIDEVHEVRTTRLLGALLVVLSVVMGWLLCSRR